MKDYQYTQKKYLADTYVNRQLTLVKGSGIFLIDEHGQKYLDLMSNYGVSIFGYDHPVLTNALVGQLRDLTTLHGSFTNDVRAEASEALVKTCGSTYDKVYWSNSGTEAVEAALKFAVLATNKKKFIVCEHGYHGKTLGALSATAGEKYKKPFEPLLWNFLQIPFNDTVALEKAIDSETAGFIVEPVQGEGGIYVPDSGYLQKVRQICSAKNILLIIDEIQTGIGRTGTFLASQKEDVSADILCLGKGLAAGIPVGATVVNQKVAGSIFKHIHTSTFGGNPLTCAGVLATLQLLNQNQLQHIESVGTYFKEQLSLLNSRLVVEVRGTGLMLGLVVNDQRNQVLKLLQEHRILAIPSGENVVRFLPPYILKKQDVDTVIKTLQEVLNKLK